MPKCRCATRNLSEGGGRGDGGGQVCRTRALLDKHFVKNTRKRGSAGKYFGVFSPRYP